MKKHIGNLVITKDNEGDFRDVVEVTGDVYVYDSAKLDALTTVGGSVSVSGSAKLDASALTTVGGSVSVYGSAKLDALTTVGGSVSVSGSAKLDASALTTKNCPKAKSKCDKALAKSLKSKKLILADGILAWRLGEKTVGSITVFKIKIVGKLTSSYLVKRGDKFAHGDTVKKAKEDLVFKVSTRDKSAFDGWAKSPSKKISLAEAIEGYRVITGACESGVRNFVKSLGSVPKRLSPKEIVKLTEGKYGNAALVKMLEG